MLLGPRPAKRVWGGRRNVGSEATQKTMQIVLESNAAPETVVSCQENPKFCPKELPYSANGEI